MSDVSLGGHRVLSLKHEIRSFMVGLTIVRLGLELCEAYIFSIPGSSKEVV